MAKTVPEMFRDCADTFEERAKVYGDNYKLFGHRMAASFPQGIKLLTADDWNRVGLLVQIESKLTRYANTWGDGGHDDSLLDAAVYATMFRQIDAEIRQRSAAGTHQPGESSTMRLARRLDRALDKPVHQRKAKR